MKELSRLMRRSVCRLRRGVGLLERLWLPDLLDRRRVDVCDGMAAVAVALDAEDDE